MSGTGRPLCSSAGAVLCSSAGAVLFDGVFSTHVTATHLSSDVAGVYNSYFHTWQYEMDYYSGTGTVTLHCTFRIQNNGSTSANITGFTGVFQPTHGSVTFSWNGGIIAAGAYVDVTATLTLLNGAGMGEKAMCGTWYQSPNFVVTFTGGSCTVLQAGAPVCYMVIYWAVCD